MSGTKKRPTGRPRPGHPPKPLRAFVLIQTLPGRVAAIVGALKRIEAVRQVDPVTGPYDIVARLELEDLKEISPVVAGTIGGLKGVTRTTTLLCV